MSTVNDLIIELSDYNDETSRFYSGDNSGAPVDAYGLIYKISDISKQITSFDIELKFDRNYTLNAANAYNMSSGDLNLSLEGGHTPLLGKRNVFRVIANGTNAVNLTGFDTNGLFPNDLDGKILLAGTYIFECTYDVDGIRLNVFGSIITAVHPPQLISSVVEDATGDWVFTFTEPITTTTAGWSLIRDLSNEPIITLTGSGTSIIRMTTTIPVSSFSVCSMIYDYRIGDCLSVKTGLILQPIDSRNIINNVT